MPHGLCIESFFTWSRSLVAEVLALRRHLRKNFGTLINAWKTVMDVNKDGEISYQEFANTCRVR